MTINMTVSMPPNMATKQAMKPILTINMKTNTAVADAERSSGAGGKRAQGDAEGSTVVRNPWATGSAKR